MSELEHQLADQLSYAELPQPVRQWRFHPTRKWQLDFAWPERKIAVEVQGGIYRGGGHTSVTGMRRDIEKFNAAVLLGWKLLLVHGDMIRDGSALSLIETAFGRKDAA